MLRIHSNRSSDQLTGWFDDIFGWTYDKSCWLIRKSPIINQIVRKHGCTTNGRRLAALGISAYSAAQLGPVVGPLVGHIGTVVAVDCICGKSKDKVPTDMEYVSSKTELLKNPIFWVAVGGVLVSGLAAIYIIRK